MTHQLTAFTNSEISVRFKEPLLTRALNEKAAIHARGVYRGFKLSTHAAANTVTIVGSPNPVDSGASTEHVANYVTGTNRAITLRKTGGDFSVDLTALADGGQKAEVVIAIFADYTSGRETLAEVRAYEVSPTDEFTVAAERDELVILGTVFLPIGGGVIPAADITYHQRTSAWAERGIEDVAWTQVVRNARFDIKGSIINSGGTYSLSDNYNLFPWRGLLSIGSANWIGAAILGSGGSAGSASINISHLSPTTATLTQKLRVPVRTALSVASRVRIEAAYRQDDDTSAGTMTLELDFEDRFDVVTTKSFSVDISNSTSMTTIGPFEFDPSDTISSGTGVGYLVAVRVSITGAQFNIATSWLNIDRFLVWVENHDPQDPTELLNHSVHGENVSGLAFIDPDTPESANFWDRSIIVVPNMQTTTPSLVWARRDGREFTENPMTMDIRGGLILGKDALNTDTLSTVARVQAPYDDNFSIDYTLMWESERNDGASQPAARIYVAGEGHATFDQGSWVKTVNASWDGTQWLKDAAASGCTRFVMQADGGFRIETVTGAQGTPFAEAVWQVDMHARGAENGNETRLTDGILAFNAATAISNLDHSATPIANALYAKNVPKAWARIQTTSGIGEDPEIYDGFNISSGGYAGGDAVLNFNQAMANSNYSVIGATVALLGEAVVVTNSEGAGGFRIRQFEEIGGVLTGQNLAAIAREIVVMVFGEQ